MTAAHFLRRRSGAGDCLPRFGGSGGLWPVCWCIHSTMRQFMDFPSFRDWRKKSSYTFAGQVIVSLFSPCSLFIKQKRSRCGNV